MKKEVRMSGWRERQRQGKRHKDKKIPSSTIGMSEGMKEGEWMTRERQRQRQNRQAARQKGI